MAAGGLTDVNQKLKDSRTDLGNISMLLSTVANTLRRVEAEQKTTQR